MACRAWGSASARVPVVVVLDPAHGRDNDTPGGGTDGGHDGLEYGAVVKVWHHRLEWHFDCFRREDRRVLHDVKILDACRDERRIIGTRFIGIHTTPGVRLAEPSGAEVCPGD